jgi:cysteinyl-tRNA synthetase
MYSLFSNIKKINILAQAFKIDAAGASRILDTFRVIDSVLGCLRCDATKYAPEVRQFIEDRERARSEKNWALADKLREQLRSLGVTVQDRKLVD